VRELGSLADVALGPEPSTVSIGLAPDACEAAASASQVLLVVEDITMDHHPGIVYAIYLNLPGGDESAPGASELRAGLLSFFGVGHGTYPGGEGGSVPRQFDVTPVVRRLVAQDRWNPRAVTLTFVPTGVVPPEGYEGESPMAGAADANVRLGRVTLLAT
jgi:tyrosinase